MKKVWTKAMRVAFRKKMLAAQGKRAPAKRSRKGKRENGQLLTILANPALSRSSVNPKALAAFRKFHQVEPKKLIKLPKGAPDLIVMGTLREVVYQPTRGVRKGPAFFHRFGKGARLAATVDGKQVFLIPDKGKPFRVDWERGIIG